jgi:two-component system, sensor histidine kinase PdtaS
MQRILRSPLPERFAGKLPSVLVEIGIGVSFPLFMALSRLALVPWTGEFAPFALVFVGVVGAAVLAGWRSGLLSLVVGQALVWYLVMEPRFTFGPKEGGQVGALLLASIAQLLALVIIALYQREVDAAWSKSEAQMGLLQQALREIDHRTTNNYQTVLALILAQSRRAGAGPVKEALQQVADRITAVAQASRSLALSSENLKEVRLADHLRELTAQIERGLGRPEVRLQADFADVAMAPDRTVFLSILVNELVTNALKHAFPGEREGVIRIALDRAGDELALTVEDDGVGMAPSARSRGTGLGGQLITTFTRQLCARHEVVNDARGTRHRIRIPMAS